MIDYCAICTASKHVKSVICTRCKVDSFPIWKPFDIQKKATKEIPLPIILVEVYKESFGKGKEVIAYDTCTALRETLYTLSGLDIEYTDNDRFIGFEVYPNHYGIPCFAFPIDGKNHEWESETGYNKNGL